MASRSIFFDGNLSKPYALEESEQLFIIRVKKGKDPDVVLKNTKGLKKFQKFIFPISAFIDSDAYVYEFRGTAAGRDNIKEIVRKESSEHIQYIGTVFQYSHSNVYQIYTGNIFFQFDKNMKEKDCLSFLDQKQLVVKRKLLFGKNAYFCEPAESLDREIFSYCESILHDESDSVKYCHPELVTELRPSKQLSTMSSKKSNLPKDWWLESVDAFKAWNLTQGEGTTIAIIDDGIDRFHPAFKNKIVHAKDMLDKKGDRFPEHRGHQSHGTACASIASSLDNNAWGIAPRAKIMPIRITGIGSVLQAEAIYWAVNNGADVISCSWGPPDGKIFNPDDNELSFPLPDHTKLAFQYAKNHGRNGKGCPIVFAAGNGKEPAKFDGYASAPEVMAIASVNHKNLPTVYSDYGSPVLCTFPSGDFDVSKKNKLINPSGIMVADQIGPKGSSKDDYYALFTGTSASCPGVAGTISLMLSLHPKLNIDQIKRILIAACEKIGNPKEYNSLNYHELFGYGLLNTFQAVLKSNELKHSKISSMKNDKNLAISLHIGINNVDPSYYRNNIPALYGCVNDMMNMKGLAESLGYETHAMMDHQATIQNIYDKIVELGNRVDDNGTLLITYAGHGVQFTDKATEPNSELDNEDDGKDESWVTYDGFMLDDKIYNSLAAIKSNIKVLFISDSCHSEGMSRDFSIEYINDEIVERGITEQQALDVLDFHEQDLDEIRGNTLRSLEQPLVKVLNLSACKGEQTAKEKNSQGVFSKALIDEYKAGAGLAEETYETFMNRVIKNVKDRKIPEQDPNYTFSHIIDEEILKERPFNYRNSQIIIPTDSVTNNDKTITPDEEEKEVDESLKSLSIPADELLVDYGSSDEDILIESPKNTKRSLSGNKSWDEAYEYVEQSDSEDLVFVEPNIISNIYTVEDSTQERGGNDDCSASENGRKYLDTYPRPDIFGDPKPFTWHLSDSFSQLKNAREEVFPELKYGKKEFDGPVVKIGHIDTGVIEGHPSLPKYIQYDEVKTIHLSKKEKRAIDKDEKFALAEQQGHGNATATVLAGNWLDYDVTDGEFQGFYGAFPYAKVLPIKISETVVLLSGRLFAEAVDYAIKKGCHVITMSMSGLPSKVMARAVNKAYEAGVVIVAAASNSWSKGIKHIAPKKTLYPARYDRVIAAVGCTYTKRPYLVDINKDYLKPRSIDRAAGGDYMQSCYGPASVMPTTVAAYSPNIMWFDMKCDEKKHYFKRSGGGTSSATPQVAAAAGLYLQEHMDVLMKYSGDDAWKRAEIIRQAIFRSADKDSEYTAEYFGQGMLKAHNALDDAFAPSKLRNKIEKAKKAPERRRFLGGLIHVLSQRSIDDQSDEKTKQKQAVIEDMLIGEINQLICLDPNLFKFQEVDIDAEEFDLAKHPELINALIDSELASDHLKQILSANTRNALTENNVFKSSLIKSNLADISIRSTSMNYEINDHRSYKEGYGEHGYFVDEFEITTHATRDLQRSDLTSSVEIELIVDQSIEQGVESALLFEKTYEEGTICEWKFSDDILKKNGERSINTAAANPHHYVLYDQATHSRGLGEGLKKVVVKVIKWASQKGLKELVKKIPKGEKSKFTFIKKNLAKLGEHKYGIMVYDLLQEHTDSEKGNGWKDIDEVQIDNVNKKSIYKHLQDSKKKILVFVPGLFKQVPAGYDLLLSDEGIRKRLLKNHARYIIGLKMPTIVNGIEGNADELHNLLKSHLKHKAATVLCLSRGGVVARHLFEKNWINNKTLNPTIQAPFILDRLIMCGTPNQGTRIASTDNWRSLFNMATNVARMTIGVVSPVVPKIMSIIKLLGVGFTELDGINDLEEESKILEELNMIDIPRDNYYVFTSNYEPHTKLLKRLFDQYIVDPAIFKNQMNDTITPTMGAIFKNEELPSVVKLKQDHVNISPIEDEVSHFKYLDPNLHRDLVDRILEKMDAKK